MNDFDNVKLTGLNNEVDQTIHAELIRIRPRPGSPNNYDVKRELYNPADYTTVKKMAQSAGEDYTRYSAYSRNYCNNQLTAITYLHITAPGESYVLLDREITETAASAYLSSHPEILPRRHYRPAAEISTAQTYAAQSLQTTKIRKSFIESEPVAKIVRAKPRQIGGMAAMASGPFAPEPTNQPPTITSAASLTVETDHVTTYNVTTSGTKPVEITITTADAYITSEGSTVYIAPLSSDVGSTGGFTITATNEFGTDVLTVTANVVIAGSRPMITSPGFVMAESGTEFNYQVTASGIGTITVDAYNVPDFLTFDADSGTIYGRITETGTYAITLTASNVYGPTTKELILNAAVSLNSKPRIVTKKIVVGYGSASSDAIVVAGNGPITVETGTLPSFISLHDGTLTTTDVAPIGMYYVDVTASNAHGVDRQLVTVVVSDEAPTITSDATIHMVAGSSLSYHVRTEGVASTVSITDTPSFVNAIGSVVSINPPISTIGTYDFTVTATNRFGTTTQTVTIIVAGAVPIITSATLVNVPAGSTKRYIMTAYGSGVIAYDVVGLPSYATRSSNVLTLSPSSSDLGTTATIVASNAYGSTSIKLTITTTAAPTITSGTTVTLTAGQQTRYTMTATGTAPLNYSSVLLPSFASLYRNILTISPAADDVGSYTAILRTSNTYGSDTVTINIVVLGIGPQITSTSTIQSSSGVTQTYVATTTGTSPTITFTGLPDFVSRSGNALTISPGNDIYGSFTFTITAVNSIGSDTLDVTIVVAAVEPSITSFNSTFVQYGVATEYVITTTGTTPVTISCSSPASPYLTVSVTDNVLTLTGTSYPLTTTLTVTATNVAGSTSQTLSVTTRGTPPAIDVDDLVFVIDAEAYDLPYSVVGFPAPTITLTGDVDVIEDLGTALRITTDGSKAVYTITLTAGNDSGEDSKDIVIRTDGTAPTITSATSVSISANEISTYTITTTGSLPTISTSTLPAWITLDGNVLTFEPGGEFVGATDIIINANNVYGSDSITLAVTVVGAPSITSALIINVATSSSISYTATANSATAVVFSLLGAPGWLSIDPNTGIMSGTSPGSVADVSATLVATNLAGYDSKALDIRILATPVITSSIDDQYVLRGSSYDYATTATGGHITFTSTSIWDIDPNTGEITGTVGTGSISSHETYTFDIVATNAIGSDTVSVTVYAGTAPAIGVTTIGVQGGDVLDWVPDVDGMVTGSTRFDYNGTSISDHFVFTLGDLPVFATESVVSGQKSINFAPDISENSTYVITLTAENEFGSDTVSIDVVTDNAPHISSALSVTAYMTGTTGYDITATGDTMTGYSATVHGGGALPGWITLTSNHLDISPSISDTDIELDITATNIYGSDTKTLSISVVDGTPIIVSSLSKTAFVNLSGNYVITATGPSLSYGATYLGGALPAFLSRTGNVITINSTSIGNVGSYNIEISATNAYGTDTETLVLLIAGPPTITSGSSLSRALNSAIAYTITATGAGSITYGLTSAPGWLSVNSSTGVLSGTTPASSGSATFNVTATNPSGTTSQSVTVSYNSNAPVITSALTKTAYYSTSTTYTITATGAGTISYSASYMGGALPGFMSLTGAVLTIYPSFGDVSLLGTAYNIDITATNTHGSDNDTLVVTAYDRPHITTPATDPITVARAPSSYVFYDPVATGYGTLTWSASGLPGWLSINPSTGQLSGTTPSSPGIDTFTIYVANASSVPASSVISFAYAGNTAITSSTDDQYVWRGYPLSNGMWNGSALVPGAYTATASGGLITWSLDGAPSWLSIDPDTGEFMGTPDSGDPDSHDVYTFDVIATNPIDSDSITITIYAGDPCFINGTYDGDVLVGIFLDSWNAPYTYPWYFSNVDSAYQLAHDPPLGSSYAWNVEPLPITGSPIFSWTAGTDKYNLSAGSVTMAAPDPYTGNITSPGNSGATTLGPWWAYKIQSGSSNDDGANGTFEITASNEFYSSTATVYFYVTYVYGP